ncbi:thiamine-phosphate kinase [bacterium]|nr:thiamine-phosphate kinase [bacterium]
MEKEFIKLIKSTLNSEYIGDDCAYLRDLGIVISQDSLVEDVHFLRDKITPYSLGRKTAAVNISDICASGAEPAYMTVSLSLPAHTEKSFIKEFYKGLNSVYKSLKIVGGDLTKADKIYISASIIGKTKGRNISSRKNANIGQKVVISGYHGSSATGLMLLKSGKTSPENLIKAHLEPEPQTEFSIKIASSQKSPYAMIDTSDGLMDGLSQIAEQSGVLLDINFSKIPIEKEVKEFENWEERVLFGGEDYGLIATVDKPTKDMTVIGEVKKGSGVFIKNRLFSAKDVENMSYKHFT